MSINLSPGFIGRTRSETAMMSKERSFRKLLFKEYIRKFELAINDMDFEFYENLNDRDKYYLLHGKFPEENLNVWNVCVRY